MRVRWIEPTAIEDPFADLGNFNALRMHNKIVGDHNPDRCPCGRAVERADQIRGYIYCEWPVADEDVAGHVWVICTSCVHTPEQYIALAQEQVSKWPELNQQRGSVQ
jgi:hypothetical protein